MVLYEVILLIVPLLLTPYLSRVIGSFGIGVYTYAFSITSYFIIVIQLGIKLYGRREIAKINDNREKCSSVFFSIFSLEFILFSIISIAYLLFICLYETDFLLSKAFIILYIEIIASLLDINWFFYGIEKFDIILLRNGIVRIAQLFLILIFVTGKDDVLIYILIMSLCNLAGVISMWVKINKFVSFKKEYLRNCFIHFLPMVQLFIPVLSTQLYSVVDRTIIGFYLDMNNVGYYENAYKIAKVPVVIITALGSVMLPRITKLIADGEHSEASRYLRKSLSITMFVTCAISFGLCSVSSSLIPLYLGDGFSESIILLEIMSFMLVFIGWGNVLRTQYMLPKGYDMLYTKSVVYASIINILLSVFLIKCFGVIGVALSALIGEVIICIYSTIRLRKELCISTYISDCIIYFVAGILMLVFIAILNKTILCNMSDMISFLIVFVLSTIIYICGILLYEAITGKNVIISEVVLFFNKTKKYVKDTIKK